MTDHTRDIEAAKEHFGEIIEQQLARIDRLKEEGDFVDFPARTKSSSALSEATESARS